MLSGINNSISDEVNRQSNAIAKRREQLHRWDQSETNRESSQMKFSQRVQFEQSYIFLSACSSQDQDDIDQLLQRGVDINTSNIDGLTALHQSCIDNHLNMVEYLLNKNGDINCQDNEGWTPLHAAVSCQNIHIVKYLLSHGAIVDLCNNEGQLPIDIAEDEQIRTILQNDMTNKGIDDQLSRDYEHQLMIKYAQDSIYPFKSSVDSIVDRRTGATALHVAAAKGYLDVIQILIQSGANINAVDYDGWTPLHAAAHWDQHDIIKYLIEKHANLDALNYAGQTPFDLSDGFTLKLLKELKDKYPPIKIQSSPTNEKEENSPSLSQSIDTITNRRWGTNHDNVPYIRRPSDLQITNPSTSIIITTSNVSPRTNIKVTTNEINRDEEAEAQRKHRSAQARRERRSTQCVNIEHIKAAQLQIKDHSNQLSNNQIGAPSTPSTIHEDLPPTFIPNDSFNLQHNQQTKRINHQTKLIQLKDQQSFDSIYIQIQQLNIQIQLLQKDLLQRDQIIDKLKTSQYIESSFDKREKRSYERKIAELEEESKKIDSIKSDNTRLKEENAALIRVISKLSK